MANSNAVLTDVKESIMPNGEKLIHGFVAVGIGAQGAYDTTNTSMLLSSYFQSTERPTVIVEPKNGYVFNHNGGTSAGGLFKAYRQNMNQINGVSTAIAMVEVSNAVNLNLNTHFFAIGKAY